jgi:hypothetical protein
MCCTPPPLQGDVYKFLQQQGGKEGRLGEEVVVPLVLEPFMQALDYIHERVRGAAGGRVILDRVPAAEMGSCGACVAELWAWPAHASSLKHGNEARLTAPAAALG